jgi:hypothetical protein
MKHLFILLITLVSYASAQTTDSINNIKNSGKFFKSYDDYKAGIPIEGISIEFMSQYGSKFSINNNGKISKVKDSELPYNWFYNATIEFGSFTERLMRVFDGKVYYVVIAGPISYYVGAEDATWHSHEKIFFLNTQTTDYDYYSETINGKIKPLSKGALAELLKKYNLKEKYDSDKIVVERKFDVFRKEAEKKEKYIKMMNEKA